MRQDNQGLSAARNTGLTKATGAYILFLDSDDVLVSRSIKDLVDLATEKDADLLIAGFEKVTDESLQELCRRVSPVGSMLSYEEKTGSEAFIYDLNPRECYVWRTLYKKAFLDANNLHFIPGIYFEDVPFTTECYLKAGKCIKTDSLFYLYRQREQSICSTLDARKIYDLNTVIARLWDMRKEMQLTAKEDEKYMDVIFTTFSITQWYITQYDNLFRERRQLIADLKQKVADLSFPYTKKQRCIMFFYRRMPCSYLWLRRAAGKVASLFK
jgi:glycosyltransferase involved in cell wall biosynthesis